MYVDIKSAISWGNFKSRVSFAKNANVLVIKGEFLKHGASLRRQSYYRPLIGNRRQAMECHQFQWPWLTVDSDFEVKVFSKSSVWKKMQVRAIVNTERLEKIGNIFEMQHDKESWYWSSVKFQKVSWTWQSAPTSSSQWSRFAILASNWTRSSRWRHTFPRSPAAVSTSCVVCVRLQSCRSGSRSSVGFRFHTFPAGLL